MERTLVGAGGTSRVDKPEGLPPAFLLLGTFLLALLGGAFLRPQPVDASVVEEYTTGMVDTTKSANPYITGVVSYTFGQLSFPTEGPLTVGTVFTATITNGSNNTPINQFRFATATPVLSYITPLNSGVTLNAGTSNSVWDGGPGGTGFGANLNTAARIQMNSSKTFSFQIASDGLTYLDFTSGILPAKGTTAKTLDSYFAVKWVGDNQNIIGPNGEHIIADALFSQVNGNVIIDTNTPVGIIFDARGVSSGGDGVDEISAPVYGTITEKTVQTVGTSNSDMRVTKTESFSSVVTGVNTVGIVVDLKTGMRALLDQKITDTISMAGSVSDVMALSLKIGAGPMTLLTHGTEWDYGYDASDPDRLWAYLIQGTYGTLPIFTGTDYKLQLDFLNYAATFGTVNTGNIIANIYGAQGLEGEEEPVPVPEIPEGIFWVIVLALASGYYVGRLVRSISGAPIPHSVSTSR